MVLQFMLKMKFLLHVNRKDWLTYSVGSHGPGELCYNFSISNDLTQKVNFPTWIPDCDSHGPALLDLFLTYDTSICSRIAFPPLGNSDHVVDLVSIDFPSHSQWDTPFHRIGYDFSSACWDCLCDHSRDVPWGDIFKLGSSAAARDFVSGFRLELVHISLIRKHQVKPHSSP